MTHQSIKLDDLALQFPHKTCFSNFCTQISYGSRIAIIGRNGSGKSSLLQILLGSLAASEGSVRRPQEVVFGYVPQLIEDDEHRSGGQRFHAALTHALNKDPNVLLLDEPTNHLDATQRQHLMRLLNAYRGTLIVVSHDSALLRHCIDTLWHIDNGQITVFSGNYDDYLRETMHRRLRLEQELLRLNKQKKDMHQALMKEQQRAANSRAKGEKSIDQRKWPTVVGKAKARRGEETSGQKQANIATKKQGVVDALLELKRPEVIMPHFSIKASDLGLKPLISVSGGSVGYGDELIVRGISFTLGARERIALKGDNGSGKSTLIRALISSPQVHQSGHWFMPKLDHIGYLDQHYANLIPTESVYDAIERLVPTWGAPLLRQHLSEFLFRRNEEVAAVVASLSGGERARLSLAQIAAKTPKLLILDEVTNNLDLETKAHVIEVLKHYPGAMIVISHEEDFLREIGIVDEYRLIDGVFY